MTLYDARVAAHYSAYRPPLHQVILERLLGDAQFERGLDVGCGTGRSSVALRDYCRRVVGLDPSQQMLAQAPDLPGVEFRPGRAEEMGEGLGLFDVITFAGSLHYCERSSVVSELRRVGRPDALVLLYDFEIELDGLLKVLSCQLPAEEQGYDHRANFGADSALREVLVNEDTLRLETSPEERVHLLLSSRDRLLYLEQNNWTEDKLKAALSGESNDVSARLFYRKYQLC